MASARLAPIFLALIAGCAESPHAESRVWCDARQCTLAGDVAVDHATSFNLQYLQLQHTVQSDGAEPWFAAPLCALWAEAGVDEPGACVAGGDLPTAPPADPPACGACLVVLTRAVASCPALDADGLRAALAEHAGCFATDCRS
jgi:hypothetical protein